MSENNFVRFVYFVVKPIHYKRDGAGVRSVWLQARDAVRHPDLDRIEISLLDLEDRYE